MGTSATIIFKDEFGDKHLLNRGSDGYPEIVLKDIEEVIEKKKNAWSGSEIGSFVSSFIAIKTNPEERLPDYELTNKPRSDDSYQYYVFFDKKEQKWKSSVGVLETSERTAERLKNLEAIVCQKCFSPANATEENRYRCESCEEDFIVESDAWPFKINGKRGNIVFNGEPKGWDK